ncbi:MAG: TerB family tellurite resistance protein [Anaerolineae bacterium]
MPDEQLILTLAKVLIAAAWSDGELALEEINSMKDLLYQIPQLSARQWASLSMYIESPVDDAERARLVEELRSAIRTEQDKELTLTALDAMVAADGRTTDQEESAVTGIKAAVETVDVGFLTNLVKGLAGRRSQTVASAPNREEYLEDFIQNKVYYGVRRRLDLGEAEIDLSEKQLRTLSLAGGIMAQIAHINPQITDDEVGRMVDALETYWHLSTEQAAFVASVAISETASLLDRYRLTREFADACTYEERVEFLDVLFAVAAADGKASYEEIEEIRQITQILKLTHEEFIEAKLKLPDDQRAQ